MRPLSLVVALLVSSPPGSISRSIEEAAETEAKERQQRYALWKGGGSLATVGGISLGVGVTVLGSLGPIVELRRLSETSLADCRAAGCIGREEIEDRLAYRRRLEATQASFGVVFAVVGLALFGVGISRWSRTRNRMRLAAGSTGLELRF